MSGNNAFNKSMNGIVSIDTGGTTIEGGNIITDIIDCTTINATNVKATNVDASTVNISNTIATNSITQKSSASSINFYNVVSSSATINMFSDITNFFGGIINICCGIGVQAPEINILTGCNPDAGSLQILNIGDETLIFNLCNRFKFSTGSINGLVETQAQNIFKTTTGNINLGGTGQINIGNNVSIIGTTIASTNATDTVNLFNNITTGTVNMCNNLIFKKNAITSSANTDIINLFNNISGTTGKIKMCNTLILRENTIESTSNTDIINLFNNISGTTGKINMCNDSLILSEDTIASTAATDTISLFKNITTGSITMATNLVLKQNNIDASGPANTFNLFSTITTGDLFIMRNSTNGALTIGNAGATTGNGGAVNIGTGRRNNVYIGSSFNSSTDINNGCCTIKKLQVGDSPAIREMRFGTSPTGSTTGTITFSPAFPSGITPFVMTGGVISSNAGQVFSIQTSSITNTSFTYTKVYIAFVSGSSIITATGGATTEALPWIAFSS